MIRTANPALKEDIFEVPADYGDTMTISGTVNKTAVLIAIAFITAFISWNSIQTTAVPAQPGSQQIVTNIEGAGPWLLVGGLGGFIVAMITVFKRHIAMITGPIYAGLEGLFLGAISKMFNAQYEGIAFQAIILTFGVLACLLIIYKSGLIPVTQNFRLGVAAATGAIFFIYLISFIMNLFGSGIPMIHSSGLLGIGFSVVVIIIASLNLVLDFDFIEKGEERGAPKYMEWYAAFGLMVTLVWLYLEILRLLAKLNSRQ
jgi:uncharacterized YccA/Bax inhibitor family protein